MWSFGLSSFTYLLNLDTIVELERTSRICPSLSPCPDNLAIWSLIIQRGMRISLGVVIDRRLMTFIRYNSTISGPSGNITVNGTLTYGAGAAPFSEPYKRSLGKRGLGAANETDVDLNNPPYTIHNGKLLVLFLHTLSACNSLRPT